MKISPDFREFITCANSHDVRYLIVGGYAVAFHGHPRYTGDLDIWVERTPRNAERLLAALDDFGFGGVDLRAVDFLVPDQVIQLGYPPVRIDLLTGLSGVQFEACYPDRQIMEGEHQLLLPFINLRDLKTNKRASGRHQDLADLENLQ